jgi:AcrR family transcriptional regulator
VTGRSPGGYCPHVDQLVTIRVSWRARMGPTTPAGSSSTGATPPPPSPGITAAAGVSPDTVYSSLGGKRGLLEALAESAILGPESPTPLEEQTWWDEIAALPDPRARLRRWIHHSCRTLARTSPVHAIIRSAADGDPVAAELRRRLFRERLASQTARARLYLAGAVRDGVTLGEAGQRYAAMTSPELHHLLTHDLGRTLDAHERRVTRVLESDLLPESTTD